MRTKKIYHRYEKWECYKNGLYKTSHVLSDEECSNKYMNFLSNLNLFEEYINRLFIEWPNSCEHFLTNTSFNRIAWIGQASMCLYSGIPRKYRHGYRLLSEEQQHDANSLASLYLNKWINNEV